MRTLSLFIFIGLLLTIIRGCKKKSDAEIVYSIYSKKADSVLRLSNSKINTFFYNKSYHAVASYNSAQNINKIKGKLIGRSYGHYFDFDVYGKLVRYDYKVGDSIHHSYEISRAKRDEIYNEIGTPIVDVFFYGDVIKKDLNDRYTLYFSTFPRRKLKVLISFDGINYSELILKESKLMPFLEETDLTLGIKHNGIVYLNIEAGEPIIELFGLAPEKFFSDTLSLYED